MHSSFPIYQVSSVAWLSTRFPQGLVVYALQVLHQGNTYKLAVLRNPNTLSPCRLKKGNLTDDVIWFTSSMSKLVRLHCSKLCLSFSNFSRKFYLFIYSFRKVVVGSPTAP